MIEAIKSLAFSAHEVGQPIIQQLKALIEELNYLDELGAKEAPPIKKTSKKTTTKKVVKKAPAQKKGPPTKTASKKVSIPAPVKKTPRRPSEENLNFPMRANKDETNKSVIEWRGNKWKAPANDKDEAFDNLKTPKKPLVPRDRPAANIQEMPCVVCRKTRRINVDSLPPSGIYKCDRCTIERR